MTKKQQRTSRRNYQRFLQALANSALRNKGIVQPRGNTTKGAFGKLTREQRFQRAMKAFEERMAKAKEEQAKEAAKAEPNQ